jgi:hypothetical protein
VLSFPGRHLSREEPIETSADLIAAEDVLLFVNAAITSTGQRELDTTVRSLADLRAQARSQIGEWAGFHDQVTAGGLLGEDYAYHHVHRMGRYRLSRFLPPFERQHENHIGEVITDETGRLAYLKTFRLSENQVRRGHLLTRLAACGWNLSDTATALGVTEPQLGPRIQSAGFGFLLRQDVLDHYRAQTRR